MIIEALVRQYLSEQLDVPVVLEGEAGDRFVRIERTGSSKYNKVITSVIAIQSYGKSLYDAAELNEQVKKAMDNIVVLDEVGDSSIETDYNFTDSSTKKYRYQAVYDLVHF